MSQFDPYRNSAAHADVCRPGRRGVARPNCATFPVRRFGRSDGADNARWSLINVAIEWLINLGGSSWGQPVQSLYEFRNVAREPISAA